MLGDQPRSEANGFEMCCDGSPGISTNHPASGASGTPQKDPVDYVSPNIGGIGQLLTATVPYVQYPHGMARLAPITTPGITDRYLADKIYGFPAGPAMLMASVGQLSCNPGSYASDFDHDFEIATPYYYEADLQSWGIKAEVAAKPAGGILPLHLSCRRSRSSGIEHGERCRTDGRWRYGCPRERENHRSHRRGFGQSWGNERIFLRGIFQAVFRLSNLDRR